MGLKNNWSIFGLALLMTGGLQATRLQQDFSDYGIAPTFLSQNVCLDANGAPTGGTCALTAEDYLATNNGALHVFNFRVEGSISNFTLTLTGSVPFVFDPNPDANPAVASWGYGAMNCTAFDPLVFTNPPMCGPDPTAAMAAGFPTLSADGMTVTFNLAGSNNAFVFFGILPEPVQEDTDQFIALDVQSEPTVTAKLTLNSTEVPRPSSVPVIVLASGAAIAVFRRRFSKLQ